MAVQRIQHYVHLIITHHYWIEDNKDGRANNCSWSQEVGVIGQGEKPHERSSTQQATQ